MNPITMKPVESSQISEIGHDPETNTLAVRFRNYSGARGSLYHYQNVDSKKFAEFESAKSKGTYFGANIKKASADHPFTKINEDKKED